MSTHSDRRLWERTLDGEAAAFGELFERHATPVYNYLFRRCGNWATAQDLTSIVFLELWRKRAGIVLERDSVLPLLLGIATNVLRNRKRTEFRHRVALERMPVASESWSPHDDVADRLADEQRMQELLGVIGRLPKREQDVIVLCVWMGLSYEEAADALCLPLGTVGSRLSRAKRRLRGLLDGCGQPAPGIMEP
ncbi:MAG: RNA polymerase sigma factor [Thermoleophilia bacterium]|nr:RNA polymerase sigma factor [Thermoleophilia bacterium]